MSFTPEQLAAVHKDNVETLLGLTNKAFEGVEKLVELNLQVAKASIGEAAETTKAAMSVKDVQELLALQASLLQPAAEKAAAYSRYVYEIAASTGAEVSRVAEATAADAQAKFMSAQRRGPRRRARQRVGRARSCAGCACARSACTSAAQATARKSCDCGPACSHRRRRRPANLPGSTRSAGSTSCITGN